jgi:hypothetical protein
MQFAVTRHAEVLEAVAEELAHGFRGVAAAGVCGVEEPAELCLQVAGLVGSRLRSEWGSGPPAEA